MASASACVNLDKPEQVAECSTQGTCVNRQPAGDSRAPADTPAPPVEEAGGHDATPDAAAALDGALELDAARELDGARELDVALDQVRDTTTAEAPVESCSLGGVLKPAGTLCRAAAGPCDIAESCDGVSAECPADKLAAAGAVCRLAAGDCDIAETCSGTSVECPADGFKQAGVICRAVADLCDVAEGCTGESGACPADTVASAITTCRASTDGNKCDPQEACTGSGTSCPADLRYAPPAVPTGVSVLPGTLQATVGWTAALGATGYNVKRSSTSGTGYTTLLASPTTTASPFVDSGLSGGTTYYYVVSSINTIAGCESANSPEVSVTPAGDCTPPSAPTLTVTPGNGAVTLSWGAVTGAVSYSVARSLTSGTGYATVGAATTGTTFTDSNVVNGTTYYYVVTASNGSCSSANSNEASASPACTPPPAPTGLTPKAGNSSVTLSWTASAGATSYSVYRNSDGTSTYAFINSTSQTTFTDSNVVNGTTYYYVVTASNGSCSSGNSLQVQVTPACVPPPTPTGVTLTAGNGQISLSWKASAGATLYRVSRGTTAAGPFTPIATPTGASYLDSPLVNGTMYYYVVAASNGSCWSADSQVASAIPVCTPPSVPSALAATAGDGTITLSWGASVPTPVSYVLERKTGSAGNYVTIATPTARSYADTDLVNGTTYYYRVSASNGSCSSAYSAEASATPVPTCNQTAPGSPDATPSGSVQVTLTWTASSPTPTSYSIGRSTTSGSGYVSIDSVPGTTLTYVDTDTSLVKNTTYYYRVTAVGSVCTAVSVEASATTSCSAPAAPASAGLTATNANGAITISWTAVNGATAYTVYRSTSLAGTYTAISTDQIAATYADPATGLVNGTVYFYKVSASNANGQCASAQSTAVSTRSCVIPTAPTNLKTIRTGNHGLTVSWTNSPNAVLYNVQQSTTSGSGYASVGTATGSSFTVTPVVNSWAYYYVVSAASDAGGNCSSGNSAEVSAVACVNLSRGSNERAEITHFNTTSAFCVVTCDDIGWWSIWNMGSRQLFVNEADRTNQSGGALPAKVNGGYAFDFTPGAFDAGVNWGGGTANNCP
jgi:fibronectin type 3 domain-containing protein